MEKKRCEKNRKKLDLPLLLLARRHPNKKKSEALQARFSTRVTPRLSCSLGLGLFSSSSPERESEQEIEKNAGQRQAFFLKSKEKRRSNRLNHGALFSFSLSLSLGWSTRRAFA